MDKKILILTIGLPRSGKTTWAKKQGHPIVNPDSIRLALHGQAYVPDAEPMVWVIAKYMVKALFLAGHTTVVVDATNTTVKRRSDWRSDDWSLQGALFSTSADECIQRAKDTDMENLVPVIERMSLSFEPVNMSELEFAGDDLIFTEETI